VALEITTPELGEVKKTNKDLVISSLIYNHPATLAKITNVIRKKFHAPVTFQGIRKAANQLLENEVVVKEGKEYSLSKDWILKLRQFTEELHESYFTESSGVRNIEAIGEEIKVYTFDNLIDLDVFWNSLIGRWFDEDTGKEKEYAQQSGHAWYVLANLEEETKTLEKIQKHGIKFYTLAAGKSVLDRWSKKYYEDQGFFYTVSNNSNTSGYFAVYGNKVIQCTYPKDLVEEMDKIYNQSRDFESFEITKLIKLLRKKVELKMIVMKNPVVAVQLRNFILSHFSKK
jgi:hypothetical protein